MQNEKYIFQADALRFVSQKRNWKDHIKKGIPLLILSLIIGALSYLLLSFLHITPEEMQLRAQNQALQNQYLALSTQIHHISGQLDTIENRDDRIYRSLLGMEQLDSTIRMAGMGGISSRPGRNISYENIIEQTSRKLDKLESRLNIENNSLIKLMESVGKNKDRLLHLPAIMPVSNRDLSYTASGFGMRFHPILKIRRMHEGLDFIAPAGTEIHATAGGTVKARRVSATFGNIIEIDHGFGYVTLYAHLKEFNVQVGQQVNRGDLIAWMGNTGLSAGTHLHYEVHYQGKEVDPVHYFFGDLSSSEYEEIIRLAREHDMSLD